MHLKTDTSAQSHFAQVPQISHSRNAFSIAERHLTTMQFDQIFPIWQKYIYPGDTLSIQHACLARLQTQIAILHDDLYFDIHAWFTPFRLLQDNWARFQFNAQPLGPSQDNSALMSARLEINTSPNNKFLSKSIYDYMGFPTEVAISATEHINAYALLAYNLIWNENYRDQNLQAAVYFNPTVDYHNTNNFVLLKRGKRHDVFTSASTALQKGSASTIPFNLGTLPVTRVNNASGQLWKKSGTNTAAVAASPVSIISTPSPGTLTTASDNLVLDPNGTLVVAGGFMSAFTVNELRYSVAVQQLLEADMRGGTRDVESIKHRWGVSVPDYRLQRPEYLGGQTFSFDGHVVPQTSETGTTPQANLVQFSQTTNQFQLTHSFVEHGIVQIFISARSNITYQQGLERQYSYKTRFDFYQPEFANLGEVAIKNKEIYYQGIAADDSTFGFQEYGYELRYGMNRVSSEMRSNYALSLDIKHMADDYSSLPTLGPAWIQSNTAISRNIAVNTTTADPIELNTKVTGTIARTLPMFSVPGLTKL